MRLPSAGVDGPRCSRNPEVMLVRQPPRGAGLPPSSRIPETMAGKLRIYADIRNITSARELLFRVLPAQNPSKHERRHDRRVRLDNILGCIKGQLAPGDLLIWHCA